MELQQSLKDLMDSDFERGRRMRHARQQLVGIKCARCPQRIQVLTGIGLRSYKRRLVEMAIAHDWKRSSYDIVCPRCVMADKASSLYMVPLTVPGTALMKAFKRQEYVR